MAEIAECVSPGCHYEWDFNGSVADFAAKWDMPFLVYAFCPDPKAEDGKRLRKKPSDPAATEWAIFITDYPSFQAR